MKQTFTEAFIRDNIGCYSSEDINEYLADGSGNVTLNKIIQSDMPLGRKFQFICENAAEAAEYKAIAVAVAEIVLPIFARQYPDDKRPEDCLHAIKQYIAGDISLDQLKAKRNAAAVAYDAAADVAAAACAAICADAAYVVADILDDDITYVAVEYASEDSLIKKQLYELLINSCLSEDSKLIG